ncbi:hypothetical protein Patl1_17105 [Pistacia atlantica]|uniref:Uncharacterized protein n=1 Tax=Pistacia atlantica TaxID=434234 RepID=A0ACC1B9A2_9ROSI|nr:hypothetical protein Patl1_17105 [Pistacia atlantica]
MGLIFLILLSGFWTFNSVLLVPFWAKGVVVGFLPGNSGRVTVDNLSFIVKELTKFINHCNEVKAATLANKEGGQLSIVKTSAGSTANKKDEKPDSD